jgi:hypothetical protein
MYRPGGERYDYISYYVTCPTASSTLLVPASTSLWVPHVRLTHDKLSKEPLLKELGRRWWRLGLRLAMDQDKVIIDGRRPIDPLSTIR